jgi:hypothetical protein
VSEAGGLHDLLRLVRRRWLWTIVLEQTARSACLAAIAFIILLIVGTQILDWFWPVIVFGLSLVLSCYRVIRRLPPNYRLAQAVDRKLSLADTLSTAFYFASPDAARRDTDEGLRAIQRRRAEELARSIDWRVAFPISSPRSMYAAGAFALLVLGMFGVRYGVKRTLDLRRPIVEIAIDRFRNPLQLLAAQKKTPEQKRLEEQFKQLGVSLDQETGEPKSPSLDPPPDNALELIDTPDVNNEGATPNRSKSGEKAKSPEQQGDPLEGSDEQEQAAGNSDAPGDARSQAKSGDKGRPKDARNTPDQAGENSSLMDKMRDAFANLLNKLKIQPKGGDGTQQSSSTKGGQSDGKTGDQTAKKGTEGASRGEKGDPSGDPQSAQEGEGGEPSQTAQAKGGEKGSDQAGPQDSKSGVGKNDGSKDAREAEQLAAMGKISEIIGRRAANVTGEVMVEVSSGKQQIKTPYSDRSATHIENGGEINRDEIPIELQPYVQKYFEQIHKPAPPAAAPAKTRQGTASRAPQ